MRDYQTNDLLIELKRTLYGNTAALRLYEKLRVRLNHIDGLLAMHDAQCEKRFTIAMQLGKLERATQEASLIYDQELRHALLRQSLPTGTVTDEAIERLQEALEMEREVVQ